jgi:predicted outer membrane repeat protein
MLCNGCQLLQLNDSSFDNNMAGKKGGAVACQDCHDFKANSLMMFGNQAANGGAVAVMSTLYLSKPQQAEFLDCSFSNNTALPGRVNNSLLAAAAAIGPETTAPLLQPSEQQLLGCHNAWQGLGGAVCIAIAGSALLINNTVEGCEADFGGQCVSFST